MNIRCSLALVAAVITLVVTACSQPNDLVSPALEPQFGTSAVDRAYGLAKHSTGVYVVGDTNGDLHGTSKGGFDAYLRKVDTSGKLLWGRQFGTGYTEGASAVAGDVRNNAYVVGFTRGNLQGTGDRGGYDAYLRKYTASGGVAWTRQFGTSSPDFAQGVAAFGTNVVYVVGSTSGSLGGTAKLGNGDAYVVKYTAAGRVAWRKQFGTSAFEMATDVAVDAGGNAYVVGFTDGSFPGFTNGGDRDMFIRRYNADGRVAWTRQLDFGTEEVGAAVAVAGSSVYLAGYYNSAAVYDLNVVVRKYSTSGALVWDRRLTSTSASSEIVYDASADSSGVLIAGATDGSVGGQPSQGFSDGFVYKYSASGKPVWAAQQGSSASDSTHAVLARSSSEVYAAGFDNSDNNVDAFLQRLNGTDGTTVWTDQ